MKIFIFKKILLKGKAFVFLIDYIYFILLLKIKKKVAQKRFVT